MKTNIRKLTLCALLGASIITHAAPVLIPNGDFSTAGGANFGFFQSAPGVVSFPSSGGNGGGYGLVNNTLGSWGGGLVSPPDNTFPANQGIPLANLGLVAGNTYTFSMDMKNFAGTGTGGLKLESWNGGGGAFNFTADMPASASSTNWATYSWNYFIPVGATSIKIVPLLTGGATGSGGTTADSVGFDNIQVNNTALPPDTIPNGDFEMPGGSGWATETSPTGPVISFPATAGNPLGNAVIDATVAEGFAAIRAFNGTQKTFASLGLIPGETVVFRMDMKILAGSNIGGLRIVGPAGYEFLNRPPIIGDGSTWETYSIPYTVPAAPTEALFTLVWGFNSKVAYDNVMIVLPGPPAPLQAAITQGTSVSWTAASATNQYQPQEGTSISGPWTNLGSPLVGNTVSSVFDSSKSPFYQVLESVPAVQEATYNGGFEEDDGFPDGAEGWEELGFTGPTQDIFQAPQRILTGAHTGDACMQIKVQNAATAAQSGKSLLKQDTLNASFFDGEITPGSTYTFSFWAKQINVGVSYVQQYKVAFLNSGSGIVGTTGDVNFSAGVGWTKINVPGLVAPAGAVTALIEIVGLTGAVDNGSGEVHIDDVSLLASVFSNPTVLAAATVPAVEIRWPSLTGQDYQVQSSADLGTWANFGSVISGNGSLKAVYDTMAAPRKFYRVGELP